MVTHVQYKNILRINSSVFILKLTGKITNLTGIYKFLDVACLEREVN